LLFSTENLLLLDESAKPAARPTRLCPRCESHSVARSPVRGLLGHAALRVLRLRPYHCLDCWHRFVAVSRSPKQDLGGAAAMASQQRR
jgi:hypothetical protein